MKKNDRVYNDKYGAGTIIDTDRSKGIKRCPDEMIRVLWYSKPGVMLNAGVNPSLIFENEIINAGVNLSPDFKPD